MLNRKEKLVITSWGNAEFGCELAYRIAKETSKSVILLDADLMAPKADLYLKTKKSSKKLMDKGTGLDILMSSLDQNFLTGDILENTAIKKEDVNNLSIITGSYKMDNWEYFRTENLIKIIEKCYQNYDITILLINRHIYDEFTKESLLYADLNLIAIPANIIELREFNNYLAYLKEKQGADEKRFKFIAYEYDISLNESETAISEMTQKGYMGKISYSEKRIRCRGKRVTYAKRMSSKNKKEYEKLILKLGLAQKRKVREYVIVWGKSLLHTTKQLFRKPVKNLYKAFLKGNHKSAKMEMLNVQKN